MSRGTGLILAFAAALFVSGCANSATAAHVASLQGGLSNPLSQAIFASPAAPNLLQDGSFESPAVSVGGYMVFSMGTSFSKWGVVGASGNVAIVSGSFTQNGFSFPAGCAKQWLDLTGDSNTATGVAQTISTVKGSSHTLTFSVGNVDNPGGIFGTTSTVNVFVNGAPTLTATNSKGAGLNKMVWKRFTTTITAPATSTTITFLNGDPPSDTANGLDCIKLT